MCYQKQLVQINFALRRSECIESTPEVATTKNFGVRPMFSLLSLLLPFILHDEFLVKSITTRAYSKNILRANGVIWRNQVCCEVAISVRYATPKVTKYQRCNLTIQIHKFPFKIDTFSINLLFECVKIVEFNFSSCVFLVMYQAIRLLNQVACFFRSRRETTVFDQFCLREGLKTSTQVGIQDGF